MGPQSKILFRWICLHVIFASVVSDVWKAEVVTPVEALVSSCVVLPCKFNYPGTQLPDSQIRGIWHKPKGKDVRIYDEDNLKIEDSFKGRTRLIGRLGEKNCSLEINEVKDHDIGPFCFRAEIPSLNNYSFLEKCVTINMKYEPDKPNLDREESFIEGTAGILKCYVRYTCPTHPPTIQWSRPDDKPQLSYKENGQGVWEVESLLTFTATVEDDHTDVTCTVTFHGNQQTTVTRRIYVKRKQNYFHIIIPAAAVLGTMIVFGTACLIVTKKYKRQIQELQSRNPNGVWSRISRMSQRGFGRMEEPQGNVDIKSNNSASTMSGKAEFSKPRCPSPKSKPYNKSGGGCSAGYGDDPNVYGNI